MTCVYSLTYYKVLFQSAKFANCSLKKENSSITFSFLFKDFSLKENKLQSSVQCKITGFAQEKPTLKGIVKIKGKNENLTQYFKNLNRCYWLLTFEKLKNKKKWLDAYLFMMLSIITKWNPQLFSTKLWVSAFNVDTPAEVRLHTKQVKFWVIESPFFHELK